MRRNARFLLGLLIVAGLHGTLLGDPCTAEEGPSARSLAAERDHLLWHAETLDGRVVASHGGDHPFNPASVVKVATSLEALDRLGPGYRWRTDVGVTGEWDRAKGEIGGALVITGRGDPDFQAENLMLIARALNEMGVRRVRGGLVVRGDLSVGWEHGEDGRLADPAARMREMGQRVRAALDPRRWDHTKRAVWEAMAVRRGWDRTPPPRIVVTGSTTFATSAPVRPVLRHLSNPLPVVLRRFTVYSNNDIVRIAEPVGAAGVERWLGVHLAAAPGELSLETASGEGTNRLTPRLVVRLLRLARSEAARHGLALADVLPVAGCDPGPLTHALPRVTAGAVVGKTGTLITTDGGVAVIAGVAAGAGEGGLVFCVAAPGTNGHTQRWRAAEQRWLLDLLAARGGAADGPCPAELPFSDSDARIERAR
jgi:serine-type D-Ala-D-Ala carboxypeptidase/endopeptidase (penicillin-binding protein 4)